jgi:hypothetical protein
VSGIHRLTAAAINRVWNLQTVLDVVSTVETHGLGGKRSTLVPHYGLIVSG